MPRKINPLYGIEKKAIELPPEKNATKQNDSEIIPLAPLNKLDGCSFNASSGGNITLNFTYYN